MHLLPDADGMLARKPNRRQLPIHFFAGVIGPRRPASRATLLSGDKPLLPMYAENQQECERHHDRRQQIQRGEIV